MAPHALLCVHPHPDDESIACGGVIARYLDQGARVKVVTCTGGEEGENLAGIDLGDAEMFEVRRRELANALVALGAEEHEYLGYRDSGMADTPPNDHPDSFHRADLDAAGARLARIIREFRPHVVVSDDERGSYGHPDHIKAHHVTNRAIELAADPAALPGVGEPWRVPKRYVHALPRSRMVKMHERLLAEGLASPFGDDRLDPSDVPFGVDDATVTTVVDVADWTTRKRAAMRAHASQIGEESFFLNLPEDLAREAFGTEFFVRLDGPTGDDEPEIDLFAGLPAGTRP